MYTYVYQEEFLENCHIIRTIYIYVRLIAYHVHADVLFSVIIRVANVVAHHKNSLHNEGICK